MNKYKRTYEVKRPVFIKMTVSIKGSEYLAAKECLVMAAIRVTPVKGNKKYSK